MKINREKALAAFQEYTDRYDSSRDMIRLKIEHTYRVCGLCQQIARSLDLPEEEVDIAWLTGLLHDVGRFEQQRVYGTFTDADSIDHAKYGARILFGKVWEEKHGLASGSEESLSEEIQADAGISIRVSWKMLPAMSFCGRRCFITAPTGFRRDWTNVRQCSAISYGMRIRLIS